MQALPEGLTRRLRHEGLGIDDRAAACLDATRRPVPLTGEFYRVEAVSDDVIWLGADFETGLSRQWRVSRDDFDPQDGCLFISLLETIW